MSAVSMQCVTYGWRVLRIWPLHPGRGEMQPDGSSHPGLAAGEGSNRRISAAQQHQAEQRQQHSPAQVCWPSWELQQLTNNRTAAARTATAAHLCACAANSAASRTTGRVKKRLPATSTPCTSTGGCVHCRAGDRGSGTAWFSCQQQVAQCMGSGRRSAGNDLEQQRRLMAHLCCAVLLLEHVGFNAVPCRASHVVQRAACKPRASTSMRSA